MFQLLAENQTEVGEEGLVDHLKKKQSCSRYCKYCLNTEVEFNNNLKIFFQSKAFGQLLAICLVEYLGHKDFLGIFNHFINSIDQLESAGFEVLLNEREANATSNMLDALMMLLSKVNTFLSV